MRSIIRNAFAFAFVAGVFAGVQEARHLSLSLIHFGTEFYKNLQANLLGLFCFSVFFYVALFFLWSFGAGLIANSPWTKSESVPSLQIFISLGTILVPCLVYFGIKLWRESHTTLSRTDALIFIASLSLAGAVLSWAFGKWWGDLYSSGKIDYIRPYAVATALGFTISFYAATLLEITRKLKFFKIVGIIGGGGLILSLLFVLLLTKTFRKKVPLALPYIGICIVIAAVLFPCATTGQFPPKGNIEKPHVFIITVDALRYDALSCYGNERVHTPNIDSLAEEAVLFERAYSASSWTTASMSGILTSKYPHEFSLTRSARPAPLSIPELTIARALSADFLTSSILATRGCFTGYPAQWGFDKVTIVPWSHHPYVGVLGGSSFAKIFRYIASKGKGYKEIFPNAETLNSVAIKWLEQNNLSRHALWLHYIDPHNPYTPLPPFDEPEFEGKLRGTPMEFAEMRRGILAIQTEDLVYFKKMYEAEVRYTDWALGHFFDFLKKEGLWDNSLIIFSADHGEEFWEHGGYMHGVTLHEETIRVPLIIKFPKNYSSPMPILVETPVSLLDILPTVLEFYNIEYDKNEVRGRSLLPALTGTLEQVPIYNEGILYLGEKKALIVHPWKLHYDAVSQEKTLYNLETDPAEKINLSEKEPDIVSSMFEIMSPLADADTKEMSKEEREELKKHLRALGYIQ